MVKEKETPTEQPEILLNKALLDEASKYKEERRMLKDRLTKIEGNRTQVSKNVFDKVYADYATRLEKVTTQLLEKKQDIDKELAILYETRDKIQAHLKSHQEILEEFKFRHQLGEYDRDDFQNKAKEQEDKVARFEKVLAGVQSNVKRYETIFGGEDDLLEESPLAPASEGVDEWEKEAMEGIASAESPVAAEAKEWLETTKPSVTTIPQVTIIAGAENVGKTFPVNGTISIGRSHTNQVILRDAKVSRQHAEIKMRDLECILIDLNSSNGTKVNGQKIHEHILSPNDEIQIGDYILQYQQ